jgi:MFS family permease
MKSPEFTAWRQIAVMVPAGIAAAFQIGKVPPAIAALHAQFGIDAVTAGWILSIVAAVGALAGITFGQLGDRVGHRRAVLGGLGCVAAASTLGAASPNVAVLLVARAIEGFGFLAVAVAMPPLIAAVTRPADRRLALGLWSSYMPLGIALGLISAPLMIAAAGWRVLWLVGAGLAAVAALAIAAGVRARPERPPAAPLGASIRTVLAARSPLLAGVAFGAYAATYFALAGFMPTIIMATGASAATAASLAALIAIINGGGNVLAGVAAQRFSRFAILATGFIVVAVGGTLFYSPRLSLALRIVGVAVGVFAAGLIPGTITGSIVAISPTRALVGTTQGLAQQLSSVGQLLSPPLIALVGAERGGTSGAIVVVVLALIGLAASALLHRTMREPTVA